MQMGFQYARKHEHQPVKYFNALRRGLQLGISRRRIFLCRVEVRLLYSATIDLRNPIGPICSIYIYMSNLPKCLARR